MGHGEPRVFLQVTISLKTYRTLTALSLHMQKNLTSCLITFTLKEFLIQSSEIFPFQERSFVSGRSLSQVSHPLLISLILICVEWDSHALHCPAKESNLPPDGENLLWTSSSCVFFTGCNLASWKPQVLKLNAFNGRNFLKAVFSLLSNAVFSLLFPQSWLCELSDGFSPHRFLWREVMLPSQSALLIVPSDCSLASGKELSSCQNPLHRSQQWDEVAPIISPCCWPPGSFSRCQFLIPLQIWGFILLWMKGWVSHLEHLQDWVKPLGQNFLSKALFSFPFSSSWCAAELALKHPHNSGIKRKENFILRKNSHHLYVTYKNEFCTENI